AGPPRPCCGSIPPPFRCRPAGDAQHSSPSMTWLQKLMPARIRTQGGAKRNVPEGLWGRCEGCGAVLYQPEMEANLQVCPKCAFHRPIVARERLRGFFDPDTGTEIGAELEPTDVLKFKDSKRYRD